MDVVSRWPELFVGLDDQQKATVREAFATDGLEDDEPDRDDVADLVALTLSRINFDVYLRRAAERAASRTSAPYPEPPEPDDR